MPDSALWLAWPRSYMTILKHISKVKYSLWQIEAISILPCRPVSDLEGAMLAQHHGAEDVAHQQQAQEVVAEELDVGRVCGAERRQTTAPPPGTAEHPTMYGVTTVGGSENFF